jgi:hypothetical protein
LPSLLTAMVSQLAAMAEPAANAEIRAARSIRFIISSVRVGEVPLGQLFIAEDAGGTQSLSVAVVLLPVENETLCTDRRKGGPWYPGTGTKYRCHRR